MVCHLNNYIYSFYWICVGDTLSFVLVLVTMYCLALTNKLQNRCAVAGQAEALLWERAPERREGYIVFASPGRSAMLEMSQILPHPLPPHPGVHYANGTAVRARDHSENAKSITSCPIKLPSFSSFFTPLEPLLGLC